MARQHLSARLTRLCMLCAVLIGTVLSLVQIIIDGVRESDVIDQRVHHSLAVVRSSAVEAVYNIDDELARQVVAGLRSIEGVILARVGLPDRVLAETTRPSPSSWFRFLTDAMFEDRRRYHQSLQLDDGEAPLGYLEVVLDTAQVGRDFVSRSLVVVVTGLVRALALAALLMGIFYLVLTRPMVRLNRRLTEIDPQAPERFRFDIPKGHEQDELGGLVRQVNAMLGTIRDNLAAREQAENQADFLRQFDALTELPNRALFHDRLGVALDNAPRERRQLVVMFCDIEAFQEINDEHGFSFGDQLLVELARRLDRERQPGDQVARISGDRFAVMFEVVSGLDESLQRVEQLRSRLQAPVEHLQPSLALDVRVGVSLFPQDAGDADSLLRNAETALALAKNQGLGAVQFYESHTGDEIRERRRMRGEIEAALQNDALALYYQPQFDAQSGEISGAEALLRWPAASDQRLSTEALISIAEGAGLIGALGEWVIQRACRDAMQWFASQPRRLRIAVNISVLQLDAPGFVEAVDAALATCDMPSSLFELEITETAIMQNVEHVIERLEAIRRRGVHVAVDDFGTGHSSLQYLKSLPINCLKIDQSFVRDVCSDAGDAQIVSAILGLGRNLRLRTVAEGVEDEAQLRFLQQQGCDEIQGFLLARPMDARAMQEYLQDHQAQTDLITARLD